MTFLDVWSTSSALYEVGEGLKDVGALSQIHLRNTRGAIQTFISMCSAIVVSFMTSAQGGARLMRARVHLVASCDR